MEVSLEPDVKKMYDKCKYRVKLWEHQFKKQHGRVPSKHDIREAESEVRFAYKTYFNLKSSALEQSFRDIEGFQSDEENEITVVSSEPTTEEILNCEELEGNEFSKANANAWGTELSNKPEEVVEEKQEQSNISALFSKKLFDGSKYSKRNPRKSLSFHHRKSDVNSNASKSLSQPLDNITKQIEMCDSKMDTDEANEKIENKDSQDFMDEFSVLNSTNVKIVSARSTITSKSLNVIQSVMDNDYKPRRVLDAGWISRVAKDTNTEANLETNVENFAITQEYIKIVSENNKKKNYDSDELIENSDEDELSQSLHIAKKTKFDSIIRRNSSVSNNRSILSEYKAKQADILGNKVINAKVNKEFDKNSSVIVQNSFKDILVNNTGINIEQNQVVMQNVKQTSAEESIAQPMNKTKITPKRAKKSITSANKKPKPAKKPRVTKSKQTEQEEEEPLRPPRKSLRQKQSVNFQEGEDSEPGEDDKDPEYNPMDTSKSAVYNFEDVEEEAEKVPVATPTVTKQPKQRRSKKLQPTAEDSKPEETEKQSYELEYSVKPRIVTAPRLGSIKAIIKKQKKETVPKKLKKDMSEREKLEDKVSSGNLNENYVRVDLKKKTYSRGAKKFTYSKYKKNLWKQKKAGALCGPEMDMGGCDGGLQKCFACGEAGHFARNCQKKKGDCLLPMGAEDEEEPCTIPTLEEAEQMAQDSVLAVRKSNKRKGGESAEGGEEGLGENGGEGDGSSDGEELDSDDEALLAETLKLEDYVQKFDMKEYLDSTTAVRPFYQLNEDETIIDTPQEVYDTLAMFGYSEFRPGQERAIMRILSGRSTLVTLSTGSGKSLCYQIPAFLYSKREPCISLIISPLVSLMEDQVVGLPGFLKAACLHTNQTKPQREKVKDLIKSGGLSILLVSPEAVVSGERSSGFGSFLRQLPPIAFACIDEAHCVSQWSHNFRPSYLMICRILRERLGVNVILGLTATATRSTCDNIIDHLQIPDGINGVITDVPLPNNLRLTVSKDPNKDHALLGLLLSEEFAKYKSIIVYCTRREECERVATFLRTSLKMEKPAEDSDKKRKKRMNYQAEPYHAGMAASRRRTIQKSFMSSELRIVVATVAFGMGINKSDLRAVIHYNMPSSFEGYVQEVGRAGRDGLPAHCHLFLDTNGNDENELRRHIYANSMDRHVIRKLLQKIFIPCSCKVTCSKHEVAFSIQDTVTALDVPEENISTLLCYLELHENRYVEVLSCAYITCKIISYNGPSMIKKAAKECPPLAMALALYGANQKEETVFEFPVVDVAAAMGWDSGICKYKLKNLEWITVNNQPKRSSLSVQFVHLGFRVLAPGNLSDSQLDEALDNLYTRVVNQEKKGLLQLHAVHSALLDVSENTYKLCINEVSDKEMKLKTTIREYFESPHPLSKIEIVPRPVVEEQIIADTRQIVAMYRDNHFTGRAVARIYYGISSPNYPAFIWGRCKFWRSHLKEDFDEICKMATKEIIKMRT